MKKFKTYAQASRSEIRFKKKQSGKKKRKDQIATDMVQFRGKKVII
jgi:hypothetical protein